MMPYELIKHFKNKAVLDFDVIMTVLQSFVIVHCMVDFRTNRLIHP